LVLAAAVGLRRLPGIVLMRGKFFVLWGALGFCSGAASVFAFLYGLAEEEFDLGVNAAEFLRGPGFEL